MKRFRLYYQAVTLGEFIGIIGAYALYAAAVTALGGVEGFLYPEYVHFILMPCYLIYIGRHDSFFMRICCCVRFGSDRKAFLKRMANLAAESLIFSAPYVFLVFLFLGKAGAGVLQMLLCGINAALSFWICGVISCFASAVSEKSFRGFLTAYALLSVDWALAAYLSDGNVSLFYLPMLRIFTAGGAAESLLQALISLGKGALLFGCAYFGVPLRRGCISGHGAAERGALR
ncbi:MAG: hypothetical protein KH354_01890 [Clostridiales bacterium]|nr:hypothetical protein [Clostridiales bacterium]